MKTQKRILLAVLFMTFVVFGGQSSAQEMGRYIVTIEGPPGPAEQAVLRAGGAVGHVYDIIEAIAVRIPEPALEGFARNPFVISIELDIMVYAIDAELDNSWGVKRIGAGTVHDASNKGTGVNVAIIDTGIDYTHPDLDLNYAGGYDFVDEDTDPMDDNGHGTHVAGTVAAEDDNIGVVGVAPEADLYAIKVLDSGGSGYYSDVIAALDWAVKNGIEVTNNSYGSSADPGDAVKAAFDEAYYTYGILNVCAAGNDGNPPGKGDNVIYPARYASCIAVAATDQSDKRARWSSTGPDLDISAPGVGINSTLLGGGYGEYSGTSMACPHVAGTLALNLSADIFGTADDLGDPGWDPKYGYGLVNAAAAAGVSEPPEATGSIAGTVTNADDSTAISGATVSVDTGQSATTVGDGTYTITDVPTGDRSVTASADGFESQTKPAAVTENQTTTVDFALNPVTTAGNVFVILPSGTDGYATEGGKNQDKHLSITVVLVDDLGDPVAGASVSICLDHDSGQSWTGSNTTGTDGTVTFSLKNAPSGCYTTTVTDVTTAEGLTWDGLTPANEFCK